MATPQLANNDNSSNNNEIRIDLPGDEILQGIATGNSRKFAGSLFWIGLATLAVVVNRSLYKPPPGSIFEGHQIAYYLTLFGIFLAGVAEVFVGSLLFSQQVQDGGSGRRAFRVPLVCASLVPLGALIAPGGTSFIVMG